MLTGHLPVWGLAVPRGPCSAGRRVEGGEHPDGAAEEGTGKSAPEAGKHGFPGKGRAHILPLERLRALALRSLWDKTPQVKMEREKLQVTESGWRREDWGTSGPGTDLGRQRASVGRKL